MITPVNQTSQITPNWNKKPLTTSKGLSENFSLNLLCRVIFPSLPGQSDVTWFRMAIFCLDDYYWQPNFSNHIKFKLDQRNFQKILVWSCCVTSFFCLCLANLTSLVLQYPIFNQMITTTSQNFQIISNSN